MERLSRQRIVEALEALAAELPTAQAPLELFVVGGAALVLLFDAREATKDVDAFSADPAMGSVLRRAAERVAEAQDLPSDWLNDAAKGFVHGLLPGSVVFERHPLRVRALAPAQLLAMKLSAWRDDVDIEDARLLMKHLPPERDVTWAQLEPFLVPGRELKAQYAFADLWEAEHGPS